MNKILKNYLTEYIALCIAKTLIEDTHKLIADMFLDKDDYYNNDVEIRDQLFYETNFKGIDNKFIERFLNKN